jgi:hypothetical protein
MHRLIRFAMALGLVMIATSLVMLITTTARADKTEKIILIQDCDEYNTMYVNQYGGGPGVPPGPYIPGDQCAGNVGAKCLYCEPEGNPNNFVILGNQPPQQVGIGTPHSYSCGLLYVGTCVQTSTPSTSQVMPLNAVGFECQGDGTSDGSCANVVEYDAQPDTPS